MMSCTRLYVDPTYRGPAPFKSPLFDVSLYTGVEYTIFFHFLRVILGLTDTRVLTESWDSKISFLNFFELRNSSKRMYGKLRYIFFAVVHVRDG